jgi:hypothetical protein
VSEPYATPEPVEPDGPKRPVALVLALLAALLLVVGVVVAVAGKDDGGSTKNPQALLTAAPDAVRDAGSARIAMSMTMTAAGLDIYINGSGATEFATHRGTFRMSVLGTDIEMITDGSTLYARIPDGGRLPGTTKPWVAVPAASVHGQASFGSAESATGLLDALRGVGADIDEVGTEEVNGVTATHYHAVVDLKDAIAAAPEAQRAETQQGLQSLEQLGAAEMPIDVWITSDGLPVRQIMTFDAKGAAPMPAMSMKITVDLTEFGAPVEVTIPPADQVQQLTDATELGQLFRGAFGAAS